MTARTALEGSKPSNAAGQRLDKWLWFARATKTRTLAAEVISEGKVRVNGERADKPSTMVKTGDTVAIVMRERMRILVVRGFAERRGSAEAAAALYEDRTPREEPGQTKLRVAAVDGLREPGAGRPTKRERRETDRFKGRGE